MLPQHSQEQDAEADMEFKPNVLFPDIPAEGGAVAALARRSFADEMGCTQ